MNATANRKNYEFLLTGLARTAYRTHADQDLERLTTLMHRAYHNGLTLHTIARATDLDADTVAELLDIN